MHINNRCLDSYGFVVSLLLPNCALRATSTTMTDLYGGRGPAILGVGWSFCLAFTILLALRIYVRLKITTEGGWALFWTIIAYVRL